jgi:gas vesicle protein
MKRIGSFLVGGVLGAGVALILTPFLAQKTQIQIRDRARNLKEKYGDAVSQGRLRATELVKSGASTLDDKLAQAKSQANAAIEQARMGLKGMEPRADQAVQKTAEQAGDIGDPSPNETETR